MSVADRVRLARGKRGLSQREVAGRAGLSNAYVSMLERAGGKGATIEEPSLTSLQKLADALDVPVSWLAFGGEPEPTWPAAAEAS